MGQRFVVPGEHRKPVYETECSCLLNSDVGPSWFSAIGGSTRPTGEKISPVVNLPTFVVSLTAMSRIERLWTRKDIGLKRDLWSCHDLARRMLSYRIGREKRSVA